MLEIGKQSVGELDNRDNVDWFVRKVILKFNISTADWENIKQFNVSVT